MKEEQEHKFKIITTDSISTILHTFETLFSCSFTANEEYTDTYFDFKDLRLFNHNHALRIRESIGLKTIAYKALFRVKRKNPWLILEHEHDLPISSSIFSPVWTSLQIPGENIIDAASLLKMGFHKDIILKKKRWIGPSLVIDYVDTLGIFIEIETANPEAMLTKIPYSLIPIKFGYTTLYAKEILKRNIPNFAQFYQDTPLWNIFPGQQQFIEEALK